MIGFLLSCKQAHRCAAAKCSEVCIFCKCFLMSSTEMFGPALPLKVGSWHVYGAAPLCSLTSVMSAIITTVDLLPKLPLTAEITVFLMHTYISVDLALPRGATAQSRIYICTISPGPVLHLHAHCQHAPQLQGFSITWVSISSFQSLSCSFSNNGKACSLCWGKKKSVICRGSVGRHLG